MVGVSKDSKNRPMFLRLKMIPNITTKMLQNMVDQCVQNGSTIELSLIHISEPTRH